jgi:predicted negative regulator of RcsB-dependent stress response
LTPRKHWGYCPAVSDEKNREEGSDSEVDEKEPSEKPEKVEEEAKASSSDETSTEPAEGSGSGSRSEEEEEENDEVDAANPAEIARRVAALGADDETEAFAREEERKLAERRAAKKKGKKKTGLEAAASKKLSKIGKRAEPKRTVAVAADADPLIERTAKLSDWAKKNQKTVQLVGAVLFVALLGVAGFLYYDHKRETEASLILQKAVEAQSAKIGEPPKAKDDEEENRDLYFKTFDDRRAAAMKQYKEVQAKFPGTGAAILSRLAEGSLLLDKHDPDGALVAFTEVKGSPLATADHEVKGRALEGIGFAHELKAAAKPEEKDKSLDAALAAFKEMENALDIKGFKEMAMYHQARVLQNKGDKDKAKEILLSLKERLNKTEDAIATGLPVPPTYPYLKEVAMDRLHEIDPEAAPKSHAAPGGGSMNLSPAQIRKMMEDMQKKQGKDPHGH